MGRKAGHILNLFNVFPSLPRRTVSTLNWCTTFLSTTLLTILSVSRDLFTYTIHCLMFLPLDCGGSVLGPCFVLHYLSVIYILQSSWGRESWLLYFDCLPWCLVTVGILWLFFLMPWIGMQWVIVLFPDHTHLLIETVYSATVLRTCITQRLVSMAYKWFYAATDCGRKILHFHCLFYR